MSAGAPIALVLGLLSAAGGLEVESTVEIPDGGIKVGEVFRLVVEATHPPGGIALLPEELALDERLGERRDARRHRRTESGGREIDRWEVELLAFEAGELELPAIPLAFGSTLAETRPVAIAVATQFREEELPVATSTRPEAIAELEKMAAQDPGTVRVLVEDLSPVWIALGAIVIAVAAALVWRWARARDRALAAVVPPPPPPRPAHEVALERLARLRASGALGRGELKVLYGELSELLREWAGARFGFDSLDLTVAELMEALARGERPGLDARALEELLYAADLVKFAKFVPAVSDAERAIETAETLVRAAMPAPVPPPVPGAELRTPASGGHA